MDKWNDEKTVGHYSQLPSKKRILIITVTDLQTDPMPYRQIKFLKEKYDLTTAGRMPSEFSEIPFVPFRLSSVGLKDKILRLFLLLSSQFDRYYEARFELKETFSKLKEQNFDIVIAHDDETLPFVFKINKEKGIIYDAHEYTPSEKENDFRWRVTQFRYKDWLCRKYLRKCSAVITVSDGIAKEYEMNYGVKCDVILNAPEYFDLNPVPVSPDRIRLVHHGVAVPIRKIENMIEMMEFLDKRFTLDLLLLPVDLDYMQTLKEMAKKNERVKILDPVPMTELVPRTNDYDIGVFITPPSTFNLRYSLPNKFFEYIQARLAILIGPYPEMSHYIKKFNCGIVATSFEPRDVADALNKIDVTNLMRMKMGSDAAANELTAIKSMNSLEAIISKVTSGVSR
jgi:glycosyltransferase involved in cell wall biosynthesis